MLVCFSPCPRNMWISGFNQKYCLSEHIIKQERQEGISLGVQWFRLLWLNTGDAGSIPGQGTMIHMLGSAAKKEREAKKTGLRICSSHPCSQLQGRGDLWGNYLAFKASGSQGSC